MKKKELINLINEMNFHPGRKLGQNFLIDDNMLDFIVRIGNPQKDEPVLEVGPGFGVLTRKLIESGAKVTSIEFDRRIVEYLKANINSDSFRLVEGDACRLDIAEIMGQNTEFRSIANLPYSISSVFIARLLELEKPPANMVFLLQKEMAERLASPSGTKEYGSLSVRVQTVYNVEIVRIVSAQVFVPPPAVESAVVKFVRKPEFPGLEFRKSLSELVRLVFAQRRKMMHKILANRYGGAENVENAFKQLGIDHGERPERIDVKRFIKLTEILDHKK